MELDLRAREREREDVKRVDEAERLTFERQHQRARALLHDVVSRTPARYPLEERSEREWAVRCWSLQEFMAYIGAAQRAPRAPQAPATPNIVWIGNAYARARWLLAFIAADHGDHETALEHSAVGLALQPYAGRLIQERAQALNAQRRFSESAAMCNEALASGTPWTADLHASILRGLSFAQLELHDLDAAEQSLLRSLELTPGNANAVHELEYLRQLRAQRNAAPPQPVLAAELARHHAQFALGLLPALLRAGDSVIGILANPENQEFAINQWASLADRLPPGERVPATGMQFASHWLGGEHLVIALDLPPAPGGAARISNVVITTSPRIRYFVWQRKRSAADALLEVIGDGELLDHGPVGGTDRDALLHAICRQLGVAQTIAPPLAEQTFGMSRQVTMVVPYVQQASAADAARIATLNADARAARSIHPPLRAVALYEALLALRLTAEGPTNTEATLVHGELAAVQAATGQLRAAESTCRSWLRLCRRHRAVAHAESLLAIRALANYVQQQTRRDEALELMRYCAQLAGLARGIDSMQARDARAQLQNFERS